MLEAIQNQLKFKFPQLINAFGSTEKFFAALNNIEKIEEEIEIILYKLLSHSDNLIVLSPTNLSFNLYDNLLQQSINLSKPYSIYDLEGNLCYQVSNHKGKFGFSPLDRLLILEASNLDFYYLKFEQDSKEEKLILLVIYKPTIFAEYTKDYFPFLTSNSEEEPTEEINIPSSPSGLSIINSSLSNTSVSLQWNISFESLTLWRVRYKKVLESIWITKDIPYSSINTPSTQLTGLEANKEYQIQIQSINSVGSSDWSSIITFKTCKESNDLLDTLPSTLNSPTFRISLIPSLLDISGNTISISQLGTIPIVKAQEKWGLFIQNGRLELTTTLPSSYTKACWIYLNNLNESGNIFSSTTSGKDALYLSNGTLLVTNDSSLNLTKGYIPYSNEWIFVCVTYNSVTQKIRLYINGTLVYTNSALPVTGSSIQRIGKSPSSSGINGFIGNDILLFNYSLSATNIQALYQFQLNSEC